MKKIDWTEYYDETLEEEWVKTTIENLSVGDIVMCDRVGQWTYRNLNGVMDNKGTVLYINSTNQVAYIQFENEIGGHDAGGYGIAGRCWNVSDGSGNNIRKRI